MGIFDSLKSALGGKGRLDVSKYYQLNRHSFTGTMSTFRVGTKIGTRERYGFKGLNKPAEGEIAITFDHPRIVKTLEYGKTTYGQNYILMEYLDGPGLDLVIRDRNPDVIPHQLTLVRHMAEGLMEVHDKGFIHRDVCPRNFICSKDLTSLKLIDFGLSLPNEPPYRLPGNRTGTPQYMAPEIVRRRETDHRLDIFSFGVTAYRLLTFEHPWGSTEQTGTAALVHDTKPMKDIREYRPNLDPRLVDAIHKCLAVKASDRTESFKRFLAEIKRIPSADVA